MDKLVALLMVLFLWGCSVEHLTDAQKKALKDDGLEMALGAKPNE